MNVKEVPLQLTTIKNAFGFLLFVTPVHSLSDFLNSYIDEKDFNKMYEASSSAFRNLDSYQKQIFLFFFIDTLEFSGFINTLWKRPMRVIGGQFLTRIIFNILEQYNSMRIDRSISNLKTINLQYIILIIRKLQCAFFFLVFMTPKCRSYKKFISFFNTQKIDLYHFRICIRACNLQKNTQGSEAILILQLIVFFSTQILNAHAQHNCFQN